MFNKVSKLLFSLSFLCLFLYTPAFAQDQSLSKVMSINLKNIAPIYENEEVKGYYMFYEVEKKDRKTKRYLLQFLDNNLNVMAKKYITGSNYLTLVEGHYNGENILMKFADPKEKLLTFRQYNTSAELISKTTKEYNPRYTSYSSDGKGANMTSVGAGVLPIPNQGFANIELVKNKKWGYEIKFIPNKKGSKGWTFKSNASSKEIEMANFIGANKELLIATVAKRPSMMSKDVSYHLLGIDTKTGKKRFLNKMGDSKYNTMFLNQYFDKDELTLFGLYYDKKDKPGTNKSKGLCMYTMNTEGEVISKKYLSWTKDIKKFLPVNEKGKLNEIGYMFFQSIFKTNDGRLFAVAEQYKKNADAVGITANIASSLLNGVSTNMSASKVQVEDIMVLEFSSDQDLVDVAIFEKNKSNMSLPTGGTFMNMQMAGLLVNYYGGFDYVFTQQHRDEDVFSFVFNDYDRKSKDWTVKSVTYADGSYAIDEMALTSNISDFILLQGKNGHVMLAEYNSKAKKLDMRLEKINY